MEEENGEDTGDNDVDEISKRKTIIQELRNRIEHLEDEILRLSTAESITAASLSDMVSAAVALQLKKQQEDWNNIPLASSSNAEEEQQQEEYQPLRHSQKRWKTLRESFHASFQRSSTGGSRHADPSEDNNGHLQFNNAAAAMSRANNNLVFLHPEEVGKRNYTKEELDKIGCRPFPTRIYVTNVQLEVSTACAVYCTLYCNYG